MSVYRLTLPCLLIAAAQFASAQSPIIYSRSVLNAASFIPQALPAGAIARGSIFSIFGRSLGPSTPQSASSYPLGTSLGNVTMTLTQGSTTVSAIPIYVSGTQINAIMPSNAPLGAASLRITYQNARSNPVPVVVADSAVGIFTATGAGVGPGIVQNFVSADNLPINAPAVTARPGQAVILWATGLGPVSNDTIAPPAGNRPVKVEVFVGGVQAAVSYSGRAPCCAGTDQIVFTVPPDAPTGCWVPVYVRTAGTTVSNAVTIGVDGEGKACSDAQNPVSSLVVNAGKLGGFLAIRGTTRQDVGVERPVDVTADFQLSFGADIPATPYPFHPGGSHPPPGTCTAYSIGGDLLGRPGSLPGNFPAGAAINPGPLYTITGPSGSRTGTAVIPGTPIAYLGGAISTGLIQNTLFLEPGSYTVAGVGGPGGVGPFAGKFSVPQPLTWTNRDQLMNVNRSQPLTVTWSGGSPDQNIAIIGVGEDLPANASTAFFCVAPTGANSFTVPPIMMSNIPPTRGNVLKSKSVLYLVSITSSNFNQVSASGLDAAAAVYAYVAGKTVVFR